MNKSTFCALVNLIIDAEDRQDSIDKHLCDMYGRRGLENDRALECKIFIRKITSLIVEEMKLDSHEPYGNTLEWWLYGMPEMGKSSKAYLRDENNRPINLSTPDSLYDHIIEEKKEKQ